MVVNFDRKVEVNGEEMALGFFHLMAAYQALIGRSLEYTLHTMRQGLELLASSFPPNTPMYEETLAFLRQLEDDGVETLTNERKAEVEAVKRRVSMFTMKWMLTVGGADAEHISSVLAQYEKAEE